MKILLTGASGYIGRNLVDVLTSCGFRVTAIVRNASEVGAFQNSLVNTVICDITDVPNIYKLEVPDVLIDLAWNGLENYDSPIHDDEQIVHEKFLSSFIDRGLKHLIVSGTCQEFGVQEGELAESSDVMPTTRYALAKNRLRLNLNRMKQSKHFTLQWLRIFYVFGEHPKPGTILDKLSASIKNGEPRFQMSEGTQLRDFINVKDVSRAIKLLAEHPEIEGEINVSTGKPIQVRDLVANFLRNQKQAIDIEYGSVSIPKYEAKDFWGRPETLATLGFECESSFID